MWLSSQGIRSHSQNLWIQFRSLHPRQLCLPSPCLFPAKPFSERMPHVSLIIVFWFSYKVGLTLTMTLQYFRLIRFSKYISESEQGHAIYTFVNSHAYLQSIKVLIFVRWIKRYRKLCLLCMLNNPNTLRWTVLHSEVLMILNSYKKAWR